MHLFIQKKSPYFYLGVFSIFILMLWTPSLFIPFWGDDYFFLTQARDSRLSDSSWWLPFMQASETGFWRPLSMDTGWRFVEQILQGNVLYAHIYSWCLTVLSLFAIALFAYQVAKAMQWSQAILIGALTAAMHAVHIVTYLPLHWVAAMNSPTLVFFLCITLAVWVAVPRMQGWGRWLALLSLPLLQLLALFSKEAAILIPALVLVLALFLRERQTYKTAEILIWIVCVLLCLFWLYFYKEFTPNRHPAYGVTLGENLLINSLGLLAWLFNVPREAVRMIVTERYFIGGLWAAVCFIPMAIIYWLSLRSLKPIFSLAHWAAALGFLVFAYGPYFVLANQTYEYYAAVAAIFPLLLVARALLLTNKVHVGLLLIGFSSLVAVQGTRSANYPAVIDRAFWAEQQIHYLQRQPISVPLLVSVTNEHQFAALGVQGLEWRLSLPKGSVILTHECKQQDKNLSDRILRQNDLGNFVWHDCP